MLQMKKILFPIDFSESCCGAGRYVEALAGRFQAELSLLHVLDSRALMAAGTASLEYLRGIDLREELLKSTRERLILFLADELKHLDVKRDVVEGEPGLEIVSAGRESGADLIMMPTHGFSLFRRYILGSVTSKVLHDAECAVWTGVHLENAPVLEEIRYRKVLCAVDLGPQSEKALGWAAAFADEYSAELIVVHAVPFAEGRLALYFEQKFVSDLEARAKADVGALLTRLGIAARTVVGAGEPAQVVSEIAQAEGVDQLVIARGAVTGGLGRLRTHAYSLIRSSPCPVVSV